MRFVVLFAAEQGFLATYAEALVTALCFVVSVLGGLIMRVLVKQTSHDEKLSRVDAHETWLKKHDANYATINARVQVLEYAENTGRFDRPSTKG